MLDSLSEIRLLAQSTLRYRKQILARKQFFAQRNCTVLLLDDRTAEYNDLQLQSVPHGEAGRADRKVHQLSGQGRVGAALCARGSPGQKR